jgi:hypothetical protein
LSETGYKLSKKHKAFCDRYVECFDAKTAYIEVFPHVKLTSAYTLSGKLLQKVEVKEYLGELLEERKQQILVDSVFVLQKHLEVVNSNYVDAAIKHVDEAELGGMPENVQKLVQGIDIVDKTFYKGQNKKEIDYTERKYKFKFMSKDKNIQGLGKTLGMYLERLDVSGMIGIATFASAVSELHDAIEKYENPKPIEDVSDLFE